jgi:hypothetical protein
MKKFINYQWLFISIASICGFSMRTYAADLDTANPYFEINRLMGTMATADHISFNASYYFESYDSVGYTRDTLAGLYKINGQQFYAKIDSTVIVQNNFYNLAINNRDSSIIIARTQTVFPTVVQKDILDKTLQSSYLSKIISSDSANTRKLSFVFNLNSPYSAYDLVYDTVSYNLKYIKYRLRHYAIAGMQNTYYTQINLVFTNYQNNVFTDSVFDQSVYISRINGVFTATSPYSTYVIYNQVMNQ